MINSLAFILKTVGNHEIILGIFTFRAVAKLLQLV